MTVALVILSIYGRSQDPANGMLDRPEIPNLNVHTLDLKNLEVQRNLDEILRLERKRKGNKTVGIILSSVSVTAILGGGAMLLKGGREEHGILTALGGIAISSGVVSGGISVAFWDSSKRRKRERDRLIEKINGKDGLGLD